MIKFDITSLQGFHVKLTPMSTAKPLPYIASITEWFNAKMRLGVVAAFFIKFQYLFLSNRIT